MFRDKNIDDVATLIQCSPQVVALASDSNKHFINVPDVPESSLFSAQRSSKGRSKLGAPVSNSLVRYRDTPLGKQIFDIAIAEREPMIEPDGMADDFRRKSMIFIYGFHPAIIAEICLT
jgi:hypothetical protein